MRKQELDKEELTIPIMNFSYAEFHEYVGDKSARKDGRRTDKGAGRGFLL